MQNIYVNPELQRADNLSSTDVRRKASVYVCVVNYSEHQIVLICWVLYLEHITWRFCMNSKFGFGSGAGRTSDYSTNGALYSFDVHMHTYIRVILCACVRQVEREHSKARSLMLRYRKITGGSWKSPKTKNVHESSRDGKISPLRAVSVVNMNILIWKQIILAYKCEPPLVQFSLSDGTPSRHQLAATPHKL